MYLFEKYLLLLDLQIKISLSWIVDNNKNSCFICCPTFQSKLINLISRLVSETDQNEARARRQILKAWNYVKWNINWSKLFLGVATSNHPPAAIAGHQEQGRWLAPRLPLQHHTSQGIQISMYFNEDPTDTPLAVLCQINFSPCLWFVIQWNW